MSYPFPINNEYTAVAIAYRNMAMIADEVLPPTPTARKFTYLVHTKEEGYTLPDTKVGRKGRPNQVSFTASETTEMTEDYALDDPIPNDDIESNNIPGLDPVGKSTEFLTDLLLLDREKRTADLVFAAASYPTGNKITLSGTDQFSDYSNSDPVSKVLNYLDVPLMRPNIAVFGQDSWRVFRQHPKVVEACKGTGAGSDAQGTVTRQQVAELLEVEEILVGQGFLNTAKKGQTPTFARVWGKHISLLYRNRLAGPQTGVTFGFTAKFGTRIAGQIPDPNIGMRGGVINRVGMSCKEVISAADLGYLITNAVA
jgi:hypothetical protein